MKRLALIATVPLLLVLAIAGADHFGRRLTEKHVVGRFEWNLPPETMATLSESLALKGVQLALSSSSSNPADWRPLPATSQSPDIVLRDNTINPNTGLVILSNSSSTAQLYARVELTQPTALSMSPSCAQSENLLSGRFFKVIETGQIFKFSGSSRVAYDRKDAGMKDHFHSCETEQCEPYRVRAMDAISLNVTSSGM